MAASVGHIRKRRYQPSITDFFSHGNSQMTPSLSLQLPEETQASLLTVGMRVRKSVPEGYKTHKTIITTSHPLPSSAPPKSSSISTQDSPRHDSRELMPFCGLFKTGGLAAQQLPRSSAPAAVRYGEFNIGVEDDSIPALSISQDTVQSSQDSFISDICQAVNSKKRSYEDEANAEVDNYFAEIDAAGLILEQESQAPRRIVKMKSIGVPPVDSLLKDRLSGNDFEEATFLTPMDMGN